MTNSRWYYTTISSACLLVGAFLFAWYHHLIIFRLPITRLDKQAYLSRRHMSKKTAQLHYWHNDAWHAEDVDMLWSDDPQQSSQLLLENWLTLLDEEQSTKKVSVQSTLVDLSAQHLYVSFDRSPFEKSLCTFDKWMWIEGLLKTIKQNCANITHVTFLVHHQPMNDAHLDFCNAWPVIGFGRR